MALVLLTGFALGAFQLNADILWVDEMHSVSAFGARDEPQTLPELLQPILEKTYVPLYFLIGAGWAELVGWSQVALRHLSLLFGVLTIAWLYRLTADVLDRRAAMLAAFLLATNAFAIIYFHELRFYTMWMFLSLGHAWHYWRLADGAKTGPWGWFIFVATASALAYTHPFSLFMFIGLGLQHLLLIRRDRRWLEILAAWGLSLLTFAPYIPLLVASFLRDTGDAAVRAKAFTSLELAPMLLNVFANGLDLLWLIVLAAGAWTLWRMRSPAALRLLLALIVMTLALFVFHERYPFLSDTRLRYFLVALAFALALFAHFLIAVPRSKWLVPLFVALWLSGGYKIYRQAEHWEFAAHRSLLAAHPPFHRFTDALQGKLGSHDALVGFIQSSFLNNGLHFGFSTVDYYSQTALGVHGAFIYTALKDDELVAELDYRLADHPYLLFAYEPSRIPENLEDVRSLLERKYIPCDVVVDTDVVFVQRYNYHTLPCDREMQPIEYDNGIRIVDKFADYDADAKTVRVVTGWEVAHEEQLEAFNVSVQLITPDWQSLRSAPDRHLYDDVLPWYVVELSTADLPAGDYRAMVILYDRATVKKIAGVDIATGLESDIFSVLNFTIDS